MSAHDYPQWELQSRKLSVEETKNPMTVIHNFFDYAHLPQVREHLWEWFKCTITGDYNAVLTRQERTNLVYFYEQLEKLVEATHVIHQQNKNKKK